MLFTFLFLRLSGTYFSLAPSNGAFVSGVSVLVKESQTVTITYGNGSITVSVGFTSVLRAYHYTAILSNESLITFFQ